MSGKVCKLCARMQTRTNDSGAFVDIGATVEGFVNASELSLDFVERVDEAVSVGDEVRVVVIDVDLGQAQLELSIAEAMEADLDAEEAAEEEAEERASPCLCCAGFFFSSFFCVCVGLLQRVPAAALHSVRPALC